MPKITQAIKWSNGMVTVFDEAGNQMSEYQGPYKDVVGKILLDTMGRDDVRFSHGKWGESQHDVARMEF